MELSVNTITALSSLQNPKIVNDILFENLLDIVISGLRETSEGKYVGQLYGSKPDVVKEIFANLLSLIIDAARLDLDGEKLGLVLCNVNVTGPRVQQICDSYARNKKAIQTSLNQIGNSLPHVVNVDWRLDYCVMAVYDFSCLRRRKVTTFLPQSNIENAVASRLYTIQFSVMHQGKLEAKKFTCTSHQLQELVYKMKEAVRHAEKIANV